MTKDREPKGGDKITPQMIDLTDPEVATIIKGSDAANYYANKIFVHLSGEDARFIFYQVLGAVQGKTEIEEKCSVAISFRQVKKLHELLTQMLIDHPKLLQAEDYADMIVKDLGLHPESESE